MVPIQISEVMSTLRGLFNPIQEYLKPGFILQQIIVGNQLESTTASTLRTRLQDQAAWDSAVFMSNYHVDNADMQVEKNLPSDTTDSPYLYFT